MRRSFRVSLEMPEDVSVDEMQQYIADAVGSWCKGCDPDSPIFELDRDTVRVARRVPK
jgi:hypothetical protein